MLFVHELVEDVRHQADNASFKVDGIQDEISRSRQ